VQYTKILEDYFQLSVITTEIDSLGINLEGYFELSFIITSVVDLDADSRIMLNYLQPNNENNRANSKQMAYYFHAVEKKNYFAFLDCQTPFTSSPAQVYLFLLGLILIDKLYFYLIFLLKD
jgi:hypothetical protein